MHVTGLHQWGTADRLPEEGASRDPTEDSRGTSGEEEDRHRGSCKTVHNAQETQLPVLMMAVT